MKGLSYFPELYPDELLYSTLARYHVHAGKLGPGGTASALFGRRHEVAAYDLPGHLDALADRLDPRRRIDADRLIDDGTLYPYYAAFRTEAERSRDRNALRTGAADLHIRLGIVAFTVPRLVQLRFCPECRTNMIARFGEPYWRRAHQLPGALACPQHRCPLRLSATPMRRGSRHLFVAPDDSACPPDAGPACRAVSEAALERLILLARASAELLHETAPSVGTAKLGEAYRSRLGEHGFMRSRCRVNHQLLHEAFVESWGDVAPHLDGILDARGNAAQWLSSMARTHRKAFHPLQHLLLRGLIRDAQPVTTVSARERAAAAVRGRAWECLNPLADHRGKMVARTCSLNRDRDRYAVTAACSCGYVYRRRVCEDGSFGPPRYVSYGPLLEPSLREMIAGGTGLRATARKLGLDCNTVRREAATLGLDTPWASSVGRPAPDANARPNKQARTRKPRRAPGPRRDWQRIDDDLAERIRSTANRIRQTEPPVRVTLAEIERQVASPGWLLKRFAKLPLAAAAVSEVVEDPEAFRRRRVRSIVRRLSLKPLPPNWKIMRLAGLTGRHLSMVSAEVERTLSGTHRDVLS